MISILTRPMDGDTPFETMGTGFYLEINGWVLSVQIASGNYCNNYNGGPGLTKNPISCPNAEIAISKSTPEGKHFVSVFKGGEPRGYVSADKIAKIISIMSRPGFGELVSKNKRRYFIDILHIVGGTKEEIRLDEAMYLRDRLVELDGEMEND